MKNLKSVPKPYLLVVILLVTALLTALAFRFLNFGGQQAQGITKVVINQDGRLISIEKSGQVSLISGSNDYSAHWDDDKVSALFSYLDKGYIAPGLFTGTEEGQLVIYLGGQAYGFILKDNEEIVGALVEDISGGEGDSGGSTGGQGDGGDLTDYFVSPTPTSVGGGTPTPHSTSTSTGSGGESECLYWKLSYCVRFRTASPTPTPLPGSGEVRSPNCGENLQTGRTVITNELCVEEPAQ